jgi:hypothetical protein
MQKKNPLLRRLLARNKWNNCSYSVDVHFYSPCLKIKASIKYSFNRTYFLLHFDEPESLHTANSTIWKWVACFMPWQLYCPQEWNQGAEWHQGAGWDQGGGWEQTAGWNQNPVWMGVPAVRFMANRDLKAEVWQEHIHLDTWRLQVERLTSLLRFDSRLALIWLRYPTIHPHSYITAVAQRLATSHCHVSCNTIPSLDSTRTFVLN